MDWSISTILASLLYTWGLGLLPAIIARRIAQKPLDKVSATGLALVTCFLLAILAMVLRAGAGEPGGRISPAWILVFLAARWIMIRPGNQHDAGETKPSETRPPLSRDEITIKLRQMIDDPVTSPETRAQAQNRLDRYERFSSDAVVKKPSASLPAMNPARRRFPLRTAARFVALALGVVVVLDLLLMASGYRLLLKERMVQPGEHYVAGEWGDIGTFPKTVLVCWYWTGRKLKPSAAWYGVGGQELDECPLFSHPQSEVWKG